jgi:predicted ATPase
LFVYCKHFSFLFCIFDDKGIITIENGECKVKPGKELILPGTIRQLITSKVDRLSGRQRDILKVASVIGKTFSVQLLTELLPDLNGIEEVITFRVVYVHNF